MLRFTFVRLNAEQLESKFGDPQYRVDIRLAVDPEHTSELVQTYFDTPSAPTATDPVLWPASVRNADDSELRRDEELASMLSKTEIMDLNFYQEGCLSQRRGRALLNMLRHPDFTVGDVQSANIVQLLLRLQRRFQESVVVAYNLWRPGNGNQRLELVIRDYLEVFREIMRDPRRKDHFNLVARAIFDNGGKLTVSILLVLRVQH